MSGAPMVYQQLKEEKADFTEIKRTLYTAFGTDPSVTYQQFIARRLLPGEIVDVYLTDLRKLSVAFVGLNDRMLGRAFVAGLVDNVSRL